MRSDISNKLYIIKSVKPICIVDHNGAVLSLERKEFRHLLLKTPAIMLYRFFRHHLTHIRSARRVAYLCSTAAYKYYRLMPCFLHIAHDHKLHKVSHVKAICGRVKTNIERYALATQKFVQFLFPNRLLNKTSFTENVHYVSFDFHFAFLKRYYFRIL